MYITNPLPTPFDRSLADLPRPNLLTAALQMLGRLWGPVQRVGTRTDEAAEVRAMAWLLRDSDPGFASDLLAAADRHENAAL